MAGPINLERTLGWVVPYFRTVSDMNVATERHMGVTSESGRKVPRDLGYPNEAPESFQMRQAVSLGVCPQYLISRKFPRPGALMQRPHHAGILVKRLLLQGRI